MSKRKAKSNRRDRQMVGRGVLVRIRVGIRKCIRGWGAHLRSIPQGGCTGPGRVRSGRAGGAVEAVRPSRGPGGVATGPPAEARTCGRAVGPFPRPAGLYARVVLPEPFRPCVRAVCDSAGSGFKLGYWLPASLSAANLAAGLPGALTRTARPLTQARWVTDDADGAPTDPDSAGVLRLTAPGRRRDCGVQAQSSVGSARIPGRVRPGLSTPSIGVSLSVSR